MPERKAKVAAYLREPLALPTDEAWRYIGFTLDMFREAIELGFIKRLPVPGPRGAHLYDVRDLEVGGQKYLDYLKRKHADVNPSA